jgi:excisionase family DNA binding protein
MRVMTEAGMDPRTSEWLTVGEAAQHARCGKSLIYSEVHRGKLRAARLGGRRELRFLAAWIDAWLLATSTPTIVNPRAPGDDVGDHQVDSPTHLT